MENTLSYKVTVGALAALLMGFGGLYVSSTDGRISTLEAKQDVTTGTLPAMREEIKAIRESLARIEDRLKSGRY
jgi:outer membrane murein-binding lipoprotein Lpp